MKEFCTDSEGTVTREFMDWYVFENSFFVVQGVLIIENLYAEPDKKLIIYFDFSDPDFPHFSVTDPSMNKEVILWHFSRQGNLTMKDVLVVIDFWEKDFIKKRSGEKSYLITDKLSKKLNQFKSHIPTRVRLANASRKKLLSEQNKLRSELQNISLEIIKSMAEACVYCVYSTMYYFAKVTPKEITGIGRSGIINTGVAELINSTYKYTGFVNLSESKIYRPVIKKDKNEPVREYERHIEKWFVRGHYRRVGEKVIWIDPQVRGMGNLEQRHYGTDYTQESELIPKIIPIQRIVYKENAEKTEHLEQLIYSRPETQTIKPVAPNRPERIRPSFFERISNYFTSLFGN